MRKVLLSWHGYNIYSYPTMLYIGMVAGAFLGARIAQAAGLDADRFAIAIIILAVPSLVGSRLFFVLTAWETYRCEPRRIWRRSEGGMSMYGGLILAVPVSIPLLHVLDLPLAMFWDAATFTILLGMAFTRVGCLLNGCCGGRPTQIWFALTLPDQRGDWQPRYPTQLMEIAFAVLLLVGALLLRNRTPFQGALFCSAVAAYAGGRILLEGLREDASGGRDRAAMQTTSMVLIITALVGLAFIWS
jgi:prolipoprotein diacylglyceryl transferase